MQITLRFISGPIIIESDKVHAALVYQTVKEHADCLTKQIYVTCGCKYICQFSSKKDHYRNLWTAHPFKDGDEFNVFIKPFSSLDWSEKEVAEYYTKNGISPSVGKIMWVNQFVHPICGSYDIFYWGDDNALSVKRISYNKNSLRRMLITENLLTDIAVSRVEHLLSV